MNNPEFLRLADLNPSPNYHVSNREIMFAKPKGLYGTTNSTGKMSSILNHLSKAVEIKGYAKAEVVLIEKNVNNILDTHQVTIQLSSPLDPEADTCVNETHLVTSRFLDSFKDIRYQG